MTTTLSLWYNTSARQAIVDYVAAVTDKMSADFIPKPDRIVVFDNDGTLWVEKPTYIQLFFAVARLKQMAEEDSRLLAQPAFKAAATGDMGYFARLDPHAGGDIKALMKVIYDSHAGMSEDDFERMARTYLETTRDARFDMLYKDLTYKPMVELIHYLVEHDFKVFLASGGGMSFMRVVTEEIYGIAKERVIGSNIAYETQMTANGPVIMRKAGVIDPVDDGPGKPVNIQLHIGQKPVFAGGNSDGDLHMLWLAEKSGYRSLSLLVNHDDAEREYAYTTDTEQVMALAKEHGWLVVSMKNDWKTIF